MEILAVGDIHGCLGALRALEEAVPFEAADTLVTLGDYVDRGPDSRGVVEWLMEWRRTHRLVALRGNHEEVMLDALENRFSLRGWLEVGGAATLESYRDAGRSGAELVPESHRAFLASCLPWHETASHLFVHASVSSDIPMAEQSESSLFWARADFSAPPHVSGKAVICGHSAIRDGVPHSNGHLTCIDTYAYGGGWLTALDVEAGIYWQARDSGEIRTGRIEVVEED